MKSTKPENSGKSLDSLIAQYSRELMSYYQKNAPKDQETEGKQEDPRTIFEEEAVPVTISPQPASEREDTPEDRLIEESRENLPAAPPPRQEPVEEPALPMDEPEESPTAENGQEEQGTGEPAVDEDISDTENEAPDTDTGFLQIRVFTARQAVPIQNAYVTISKKTSQGEALCWLALTNEDGVTDTFPLPTVSRDISQHPGQEPPFKEYNIQVDASGYYSVQNIGVPIYGGITGIQPVEMIPLPEQTESGSLVFPETGTGSEEMPQPAE